MKTFVYIGTSLDGFIARKDGDIDWLTKFANEEVFDSYKEFTARIDARIFNHHTKSKNNANLFN
jgi:dihydrofolate reductase